MKQKNEYIIWLSHTITIHAMVYTAVSNEFDKLSLLHKAYKYSRVIKCHFFYLSGLSFEIALQTAYSIQSSCDSGHQKSCTGLGATLNITIIYIKYHI